MESVRTGLRQIMQDLLRTRPAEEAVILAWPLVCGKEVAARSRAVSFHEGSLIVEVTDIAWRNQLQSFAPRYISGYEGLLGQVVRSVQFKIQHSAISSQQSANLKHSAISNQRSAKPVCSDSADDSTSTNQERFQNKRMRKG
jgi:hypothetical protein